jgi:hypothetical protein
MTQLGNEMKKIPGLAFTHEFTEGMFKPILLRPGADGQVEHEKLHPDGILMSGDVKVFIEFSRCPANQVRTRMKEKADRLAEVAKLHNAQYCVIILTKPEGEFHVGGSISIFDEYGKQSAITRLSREWVTRDEHYRYEEENYAKITVAHLQTNLRALARTYSTRYLDIYLRSLEQGRTELKPPLRQKDMLASRRRSPASLNPSQSPRPHFAGEAGRSASVAFMAKTVGCILSGQDGCAVRFIGAPGSNGAITVSTLKHLLSSKGYGIRFTTQRKGELHARAMSHEKTSFFFSLPTSSVSRLVVAPTTNAKRGEEFLVSDLKQGDIVAAPWQLGDVSEGETYLLGEVGEAREKFSATFFSDGLSSTYSWDDRETTKILKVNDINTGELLTTCGTHVIGRRLFIRDALVDPEKYLPALISGYDTTTRRHKLQLLPDQTEPLSPTTPMGSPIFVDLSTADVRLVRPPATDDPAAATVATPPTLALRSTRTADARNVAQSPVHIHTAHNDNTNTSIERSAPSPTKGKRLLISANDLPSPPSAKRKTEKTFIAKKTTSSSRGKKENPTNDALLLAFEDPAPAPITSPFSVDSPRDLAPDHELSADLPGFLSAPRAKDVSSLPFDSLPLPFPDDGNDGDVFLDEFMSELAPKRTLLSSRSTDAKSSETPVADDVPPSSNSSPGKKQRATKKTRRER